MEESLIYKSIKLYDYCLKKVKKIFILNFKLKKVNMRRVFILICITLILTNITLNAQNGKKYVNLYPQNIKSKFTNDHIVKIDNYFKNFYSNTYPALVSNNKSSLDWVKSMSNSELKEIAKILVFLFYIPYDEYINFLITINEPFHDQIRREQQAKKMGMSFTEIRAIKPGGLFSLFKRVIEDRLAWEWTFHLTTRYILIVEILDKRTGCAQRPEANYPLYECKVISDIKGNFKGNDCINIIGGPNAKRLVETGNTYLVLLSSAHMLGEEIIKDQYVMGGNATEGNGFFEIDNKNIIDKDNLLNFGDNVIAIEAYSNNIKKFFVKIPEAPDVKK
ncbi:MAG: hypothetical protein JXR46_08410 [Calditrichaceae bacterium]|nr:hypothetical protein [Calditrichaceae bacterium]MBN2709053.1 hypothetical protein [Calditrichaceae bacterium]RQV97011.1 MAG: hypothetical protein EH224_02635 [Calditrichota bacterium]